MIPIRLFVLGALPLVLSTWGITQNPTPTLLVIGTFLVLAWLNRRRHVTLTPLHMLTSMFASTVLQLAGWYLYKNLA
jgi:hypothetical protein